MPVIGAGQTDFQAADGTHKTVYEADIALLAGMSGTAGAGISAPTADGITAHAGGGQTSATQLAAIYNRVGTCATAADSVKLVPAVVGAKQTVHNAGAASLAVFPGTGDAIKGLAVNLAVDIPIGGELDFYCATAGM